MPQVPERASLPCPIDVVLQIIESVALEELAMAHIMNAEGEKLQEFIKKFKDDEICEKSINNAFNSTKNIINSLIMKEWLMINKINTSFEILEQNDVLCEKKQESKIKCEKVPCDYSQGKYLK